MTVGLHIQHFFDDETRQKCRKTFVVSGKRSIVIKGRKFNMRKHPRNPAYFIVELADGGVTPMAVLAR